jgi:SAM-dependent methyltransferase
VDPTAASGRADSSAFTERQRADAYPAGIDDHYWLLSRNRVVLAALRRAGAEGPVLDVGCGPGTTVRYLRRHGLECTGADVAMYEPIVPTPAGVIRYGVDAFTLPLEERARVRTVLLLDVLEHLDEPSAFVRRCVDAFPALGHLLITVPARQELWSNYDTYYGHRRRYDRAGATAICQRAGVAVTGSGYFFHALYPVLALQRLFAVDRAVEFAPVRHRWWHRLVAAVLYRDGVWLPGALPGSSLLLVARPRA